MADNILDAMQEDKGGSTPTPREGESEAKFMERCINDPNMREKFPDRTNRQEKCSEAYTGGGEGGESIEDILKA